MILNGLLRNQITEEGMYFTVVPHGGTGGYDVILISMTGNVVDEGRNLQINQVMEWLLIRQDW